MQAFEAWLLQFVTVACTQHFTLRKISNGVGVERVFQTHSPAVDSIAVKRKGAVRKAKLYTYVNVQVNQLVLKSVWANNFAKKKAWDPKPFLLGYLIRSSIIPPPKQISPR